MMLHLNEKQFVWLKSRVKNLLLWQKKLGITGKTMYRWVNEYRHDGNDAFPGKGHLKPEDSELRRLKHENKELKEENEIFKKVAAIVCPEET
jgi:transposase